MNYKANSANDRKLLALILGAYLLLALGYGVANPLFEAPDEHSHYFMVQFVADNGRLSAIGSEPDMLVFQEAAQPPLYYMLGALAIATVDTSGAREQVWLNSEVRRGDATSPVNINNAVRTPAEAWPWRGYALAAHLLRAFSAILGLGTLLAIYHSGRRLWPERPERSLLATALVAFLPQYGYLHGSINNDPLVILLCTAALWQLLRLSRKGASRPRLLALGVTIGLAALTKNQGLMLLPFAGLWLSVLAWRDRRWRVLLEAAGLVLLPAVALAGWLWWRNWLLYGDITASNQFARLAGGDRNYSLGQALGEAGSLWLSLFGVFGWMNVRPPDWVHLIWNTLSAAALVGIVSRFAYPVSQITRRAQGVRGHVSMPAVLLALWVVLLYASLLSFLMHTSAAQGRLLFAALLPLALGMAYGLSQLRRRYIGAGAVLLALLTSAYCLALVIPTAYALPPVVAEAAIPVGASWLHADLGQGLELVAAEVATTETPPGGRIDVALYWRTAAPPARAPHFVLEVFGREGALVGKVLAYHGGGRYPASLWPAGAVIVDRFPVYVAQEAAAPARLLLNVKLVGEVRSADVGIVKLAPVRWPATSDQTLATLNGVQLVAAGLSREAARAGESVTVRLRWQVERPPGRALTTFVHLGEPAAPLLAQADSPPLGGDYPTILWASGEVFEDAYDLRLPDDLPPGRYPVTVGLYDPISGERVPLAVAGVQQATDGYEIGWLQVEAAGE